MLGKFQKPLSLEKAKDKNQFIISPSLEGTTKDSDLFVLCDGCLSPLHCHLIYLVFVVVFASVWRLALEGHSD